VVRAIEALDAERLAIGNAFGYELTPVAPAFHAAGFGPAGDLWSVINGSAMLTALRAPGSVNTRWLTEDIPFGLVAWSALATDVGIKTPMIEALITMACAVLATDFRLQARLSGLEGLDRDAKAGLLRIGY
jgi:opine dehydrogenase